MATDPPPFLKFRTPKAPTAEDPYRSPGRPIDPHLAHEAPAPQPEVPVVQPVYELALAFSKQLFLIIELTETVERFHIRDSLDKRSTSIPVVIARALATKDMSARRKLYRVAHRAVTDCVAILDVLLQRGTVEPIPLEEARATAAALTSKLDRLGDRWRETEYP